MPCAWVGNRRSGVALQQPFSRWTWVSRCSLKQRMMEVVVTTGAISRAKLQSNRHHQQTNIQFLQAGCPSCRPTNGVKALKGRISHSMDLLTPSSPGGLSTLSLTTNSTGYLGGGLPCLSSALWCQYPQQCQSTEGNTITFCRFAHPKLAWGPPTLSLTYKGSWLPWGLPCLSLALWRQYINIDRFIQNKTPTTRLQNSSKYKAFLINLSLWIRMH